MGAITQPPVIPLVQTYSPALKGASDDPVVTYGTRVGRYYTLGKLCYVTVTLTATTMTKTTLTDVLGVSLPIAAANVAGAVQLLHARVENATAVALASIAETTANTALVAFRTLPISAASSLLTYGILSIGVLTNTITIQFSGWYE